MKRGDTKIQMSRLRDIGWECWDPIGLEAVPWKNNPIADEYDSYLLEAAGMLFRGFEIADVVSYLRHSAESAMGLEPTPEITKACLITARSIADYIEELRPN